MWISVQFEPYVKHGRATFDITISQAKLRKSTWDCLRYSSMIFFKKSLQRLFSGSCRNTSMDFQKFLEFLFGKLFTNFSKKNLPVSGSCKKSDTQNSFLRMETAPLVILEMLPGILLEINSQYLLEVTPKMSSKNLSWTLSETSRGISPENCLGISPEYASIIPPEVLQRFFFRIYTLVNLLCDS